VSNDLWIGVALSIPIGIGTGLLVAPIQEWYKNRGKTKEEGLTHRLRWEYGQALTFVTHPHKYTQFLLNVIIRMLICIACWVVGTATWVSIGIIVTNIPIIPPPSHNWIAGWSALGASMSSMVSGVFVHFLQTYWSIRKRVARFESYELTIPEEIRNTALEEYTWKESHW
jgi:hypothetical protein